MTFHRLLAQATVTDLEVAEPWYAALFDNPPQARPMDGLLEWHLGESFGVQVWLDPARAGRSAMVIEESDLDALAARLSAAGLDHDAPQAVTRFTGAGPHRSRRQSGRRHRRLRAASRRRDLAAGPRTEELDPGRSHRQGDAYRQGNDQGIA